MIIEKMIFVKQQINKIEIKLAAIIRNCCL